jgi:hypothetical protein
MKTSSSFETSVDRAGNEPRDLHLYVEFLFLIYFHKKNALQVQIYYLYLNYRKVKQSRYRPGVAQRVPGN